MQDCKAKQQIQNTIEGEDVYEKIYISHLSEHMAEELEEEFYLKEIAMNYTEENEIPYLFLKLQDKTGIVYGRIWENNIDKRYLYFKGKVIRA